MHKPQDMSFARRGHSWNDSALENCSMGSGAPLDDNTESRFQETGSSDLRAGTFSYGDSNALCTNLQLAGDAQ